MKIALVSEHASPLATIGGTDAGGQNVHVRELALALGRLGNDVTVYTRRENRATQTRVALAPGVTVSHVDAGPPRTLAKDALYPLMPAFGARLEAEWTHDPPDIAHAHFWMSAIATLAAAKPLAVPVIATFHALGIDKRAQQGSCDTSPPQRLAEEKRIAREVDRVVATSSAEVFTLMRMGASAQRLSIVPCGVDLDRFSPEGPRFERSGDVLRIVSLGRLVPRKGVDDAIAALALVPNAELVIAGGSAPGCGDTDDDERRLRALARRCGVEERVDFHGPVERDDVPPLLRSADIVVCTPWYEPFGMVALEAMACGAPVVASSVGGLVDTIIDGYTGLHVPARDPKQLAYALSELARDPARRARLGRYAVERARSRYGWSRIASDTLEIYRSLITALPLARSS